MFITVAFFSTKPLNGSIHTADHTAGYYVAPNVPKDYLFSCMLCLQELQKYYLLRLWGVHKIQIKYV